MNKPLIYAISGYKNSGKTTLTVKLVKRLTEAGFRVATIKHDGHDFEPDVPGTDSYRHREAGAFGTAVFSGNRFMVTRLQPENAVREAGTGAGTDSTEFCGKQEDARENLTFVDEKELIRFFPDADIILLEGFKNSSWPKYFCRYPEEIPDLEEAFADIMEKYRESRGR